MGIEKIGYLLVKEWNWTQNLLLYTKIYSKLIKEWNIRPETIKCLEENTWGKLLDTGLGFDINSTGNKSKTKQVWLYQIKTLLHSKETINKMKSQPMEFTIT